jgi:hypothetical protein
MQQRRKDELMKTLESRQRSTESVVAAGCAPLAAPDLPQAVEPPMPPPTPPEPPTPPLPPEPPEPPDPTEPMPSPGPIRADLVS